jgi:DNA-binding FadR family transcriptional regulator
VLGALLGHDTGFSVLGDLVDVRAALESAMAALAAQRITDDQLRELRSIIVLMDEAYEHPADYRRIEQGFHCLIMEASGNVVGRAIITSIVRHMQFGDHPWTHAMPRSVNLDVAHAGHHEIHRQIARRDPAVTARAMMAHIRTCWSWVPARP